jgi:hypothetical protein
VGYRRLGRWGSYVRPIWSGSRSAPTSLIGRHGEQSELWSSFMGTFAARSVRRHPVVMHTSCFLLMIVADTCGCPH